MGVESSSVMSVKAAGGKLKGKDMPVVDLSADVGPKRKASYAQPQSESNCSKFLLSSDDEE